MFKTTAVIDGMMCSMCEAHVCDAIRGTLAPKSVKASHKKGTAEIVADREIDEQTLSKALEPTGYKVLSVKSEPYEKKGFFARLMS